jgi:phosphatidylserine/phosphatidylglycerophosphate/cardiolipin synthase-like enzyme
LPKESKIVLKKLKSSIKNSKKSIKIMAYNFSFKKLASYLEKSKSNIKIIFDKKAIKDDKSLLHEICHKNISCFVFDKESSKLHSKLIIIDDRLVIFGSPNLTKKSFKSNYENIYFEDDKKVVRKFDDYFEEILKVSKP